MHTYLSSSSDLCLMPSLPGSWPAPARTRVRTAPDARAVPVTVSRRGWALGGGAEAGTAEADPWV